MAPPQLLRGINLTNAQDLLALWKGLPRPQSIITSPPYLDMHNYGNSSGIGTRGQELEDYLVKISALLADCHSIAADDATLWLVIGSVRRNSRLIPLPDRLANCAEGAGWTLREAITWDKQKALPWVHHGELRDITEQVLLFSKAGNFRFDPTSIRSPIPNSVWWRRYPERYSMDGALPTNLWSIPIPTQGSWAGVRTHFCPFPEELTYRMISLTTVEGDTVLDPLAGIGSVPAMAEAMGRVGYGIELTPEYTMLFESTKQSAKVFVDQLSKDSNRRSRFRSTIAELRLLKFAKLVAQQVNDTGIEVLWVRVHKKNELFTQVNRMAVEFELVLPDSSSQEAALATARVAAERPPLSKFGVDAVFSTTKYEDASTGGYWYTSGRFWTRPQAERPLGGEPHVAAEFVPDTDLVDDIPYS